MEILQAIVNLSKTDPALLVVIAVAFAAGMAFLTWLIMGFVKPILEQKYGMKFPTVWDKAQDRFDNIVKLILRRKDGKND